MHRSRGARIQSDTMPGSWLDTVAASGMVNYYLRLFLPHPESLPVGIDEQFENAVWPAVDMARVRAAGSLGAVIFLSSPDSFKGASHYC